MNWIKRYFCNAGSVIHKYCGIIAKNKCEKWKSIPDSCPQRLAQGPCSKKMEPQNATEKQACLLPILRKSKSNNLFLYAGFSKSRAGREVFNSGVLYRFLCMKPPVVFQKGRGGNSEPKRMILYDGCDLIIWNFVFSSGDPI